MQHNWFGEKSDSSRVSADNKRHRYEERTSLKREPSESPNKYPPEGFGAQENPYRTLVENAVDGIIVHRDGRLVYANSSALHLVGATDFAQLATRTILDFLHPEQHETTSKSVRLAMTGRPLDPCEAALIRLDGKVVPVEFHTTRIDFEGTAAIFTVIQEITNRKLREIRQRLTTNILRVLNQNTGDLSELTGQILLSIHESLGFDAIGLRLRDGDKYPYYKHIGFSEAFVREANYLCRKHPDDLLELDENGRPVLPCMCGLVLSGLANPSFACFTEGGSFWTNAFSRLSEVYRVPDPNMELGSRCILNGYHSVALIPVRSGREIVGLLQINDRREDQFNLESVEFFEGLGDQIGLAITRIQVQGELESLNKTLEQRIAERTLEINRRSEQLLHLASELALAEQRERQRLATILHDGLQQILAGAKFQLSCIERNENIQNTKQAVLDLIDDAIETSRSLSAELSPAVLFQKDFFLALEWLAAWVRTRFDLNVTLTNRGSMRPLKEEVRLLVFHAIRELLFNVFKHAGVKSARLQLDSTGEKLLITVEDKGVGFDPPMAGTETQSPGLGLFGIRERLSYIGGQMEIESSPGQGSLFRLIVPYEIAGEQHDHIFLGHRKQPPGSFSQVKSESSDRERKTRILIVDDHAVMRRGLAGVLREQPDMEIVGEASDGDIGVRMAHELRPDVILMDISMPEMNGIEATRIIHKELPRINILALSMFEEGEQASAMRKAGAIGYLTKSDASDSLIHAIRSCANKEKSGGQETPELYASDADS